MHKPIFAIAALLMFLGAPVAAQETTDVAGVRALVEDLRDGTIDDIPTVQNTINMFRNHKRRHRKNWQAYGPLEDITFWETFGGYDLYLISLQSARVVIRIRNNSKGEIRNFRYRSIVVKK